MKYTLIILCFISLYTSLHAEFYEGWLDSDSTGPIIPIWMELTEENGNFSGWYANRIEPDTMYFSGKRQKGSIVLNIMSGKTIIKEVFTLQNENGILRGSWKPFRGYASDVVLFPTETLYSKTMRLLINPSLLKKGKGKLDSITDIQYLMVRKGLASIKVYRVRKDMDRPWISYHVIDLLKNKEIELADYLEEYAFAKIKIDADAFAEDEAVKQLESFSDDELEQMFSCGFHQDEDLHLDNVVLYPNRLMLTLDYLNVFGMNAECEHLMYPIQYSCSIDVFKPCIRPGSFLSRLMR